MLRKVLIALLALTLLSSGASAQMDIQSTDVCGKALTPKTSTGFGINRCDRRLYFRNTDSTLGYGSLLPQYRSYYAFGDSITEGCCATAAAKTYVALLGAYLGLTPVNKGISGSLMADQQPAIYQFAAPTDTGSQLYTLGIGTNESAFYGTDLNRQLTFQALHQAALAWMALPARAKVVGQAQAQKVSLASITSNGAGGNATVATVTATGQHYLDTGMAVTISGADQGAYNVTAPITVTSPSTFTIPIYGTPASPATGTLSALGPGILYNGGWSVDNGFTPGLSMKTVLQNSSATFRTYGPIAYLAYGMLVGDAGTFSVTVDGTLYGTYTTNGVQGGLGTTPKGQSRGSGLLRMSGLSTAPHTIVVTKTSSGGTVWVDWVSGLGTPAGAQSPAGPTVIAGGAPQQGNGVYTAALYAALAKDDADLLAADGLNVLFADLGGAINPGTDLVPDATHPNDAGMQAIANAYIAAINMASSAGTKASRGAARFANIPGKWTAFTPVVSVGTPGATPPTWGSYNCAYQITGKRVDVRYDFTLSAAGTGSGPIYVTMPTAATGSGTIVMIENALGGTAMLGAYGGGTNYFPLRKMDGTANTLSSGQRYFGATSYEMP